MPVALTYFWGLTLSVQGILTPSLAEAFPDPRFFVFWALHLLIVWAALSSRSASGSGRAGGSTASRSPSRVAWAVVAFALNSALGVDYGYVNRKPGTASLLDLLGPWPVYVLASLGILLAVWALMTWPWVLADRRRDRRTAGAG